MDHMATGMHNLYAVYHQQQADLLKLAQRQLNVVSALRMDEVQDEGTKHGPVLRGVIERLTNARFRTLVIGRFNSGKSTFINALLRGRLKLPVSPTPTTGVLCEINYADEDSKKAILFPKPGMGPDGHDEPFEVPIANIEEELARYVKIDHFNGSASTSRYSKLELYWPLALCADGVQLVDTVGLDDPDLRDSATMDEYPAADAIELLSNAVDGIDQAATALMPSTNRIP
jgi:hypothetical protein